MMVFFIGWAGWGGWGILHFHVLLFIFFNSKVKRENAKISRGGYFCGPFLEIRTFMISIFDNHKYSFLDIPFFAENSRG